jgi:hypothetical protein
MFVVGRGVTVTHQRTMMSEMQAAARCNCRCWVPDGLYDMRGAARRMRRLMDSRARFTSGGASRGGR